MFTILLLVNITPSYLEELNWFVYCRSILNDLNLSSLNKGFLGKLFNPLNWLLNQLVIVYFSVFYYYFIVFVKELLHNLWNKKIFLYQPKLLGVDVIIYDIIDIINAKTYLFIYFLSGKYLSFKNCFIFYLFFLFVSLFKIPVIKIIIIIYFVSFCCFGSLVYIKYKVFSKLIHKKLIFQRWTVLRNGGPKISLMEQIMFWSKHGFTGQHVDITKETTARLLTSLNMLRRCSNHKESLESDSLNSNYKLFLEKLLFLEQNKKDEVSYYKDYLTLEESQKILIKEPNFDEFEKFSKEEEKEEEKEDFEDNLIQANLSNSQFYMEYFSLVANSNKDGKLKFQNRDIDESNKISKKEMEMEESRLDFLQKDIQNQSSTSTNNFIDSEHYDKIEKTAVLAITQAILNDKSDESLEVKNNSDAFDNTSKNSNFKFLSEKNISTLVYQDESKKNDGSYCSEWEKTSIDVFNDDKLSCNICEGGFLPKNDTAIFVKSKSITEHFKSQNINDSKQYFDETPKLTTMEDSDEKLVQKELKITDYHFKVVVAQSANKVKVVSLTTNANISESESTNNEIISNFKTSSPVLGSFNFEEKSKWNPQSIIGKDVTFAKKIIENKTFENKIDYSQFKDKNPGLHSIPSPHDPKTLIEGLLVKKNKMFEILYKTTKEDLKAKGYTGFDNIMYKNPEVIYRENNLNHIFKNMSAENSQNFYKNLNKIEANNTTFNNDLLIKQFENESSETNKLMQNQTFAWILIECEQFLVNNNIKDLDILCPCSINSTMIKSRLISFKKMNMYGSVNFKQNYDSVILTLKNSGVLKTNLDFFVFHAYLIYYRYDCEIHFKQKFLLNYENFEHGADDLYVSIFLVEKLTSGSKKINNLKEIIDKCDEFANGNYTI